MRQASLASIDVFPSCVRRYPSWALVGQPLNRSRFYHGVFVGRMLVNKVDVFGLDDYPGADNIVSHSYAAHQEEHDLPEDCAVAYSMKSVHYLSFLSQG